MLCSQVFYMLLFLVNLQTTKFVTSFLTLMQFRSFVQMLVQPMRNVYNLFLAL